MNGKDEGVRPARPHTGVTADGKRLREVVLGLPGLLAWQRMEQKARSLPVPATGALP